MCGGCAKSAWQGWEIPALLPGGSEEGPVEEGLMSLTCYCHPIQMML